MHLYLTNPSRLNLGAPIAAVVSIEQIKEAMDNESWLIGKERARLGALYDDTPAAPQLHRQKIATFDCYKWAQRKVRLMKQFIAAIASLAMAMTVSSQAADKVAYFAGGCFWCTEADFEKIDGVGDVISGFMGGKKANPSYEDVAYGRTSHRETVKVPYDDTKVSYQQLLSAFGVCTTRPTAKAALLTVDATIQVPFTMLTKRKKRLAEGAIAALDKSDKFERPITTEVAKAQGFYPAEDYHQDYYKKAATKYKYYRFRSGRDQFIKVYWKDDKTVYQLAAR